MENLFDARTVVPNPRTYTIELFNESDAPSPNLDTYISANYTNPLSLDQDREYIGITYMHSLNLTSIEVPTDNECLTKEITSICKNIAKELRDLDDLMLGVIELKHDKAC